jgi:hypothetical protein
MSSTEETPTVANMDVGYVPRDTVRVDQKVPFKKSPLYQDWHSKVMQSDNDYTIVIAASSRSAISGVGKTTLGLTLTRYFDRSKTAWNAEDKATLSATEFSKDLLTDPEDGGKQVPTKSAVIFDEMQGTLSGDGVDARRSMADSVKDVTTAIATLRYRQLTSVLITQSTQWIDKRVDDLLDALILIQPTDDASDGVRGAVFETYYNDLSNNPTRYTDRMGSFTWPEISDEDYDALHQMKAQSAENRVQDTEEDTSLPDDQQKRVAQEMREKGFNMREIADSELIDYSRGWVSDHTEERE